VELGATGKGKVFAAKLALEMTIDTSRF